LFRRFAIHVVAPLAWLALLPLIVGAEPARESATQYRKAIVGAGEHTVVDFTRLPEENPVRLPAGPVGTNSVVPATHQ
jgi:hypothetical protein